MGQPPAAAAQAQARGSLPAQVVSGAPEGFVPVRVWPSSAIEVRLPNGVVLTLPAGDPEVLRQALLVVSQIPAPAHRVTGQQSHVTIDAAQLAMLLAGVPLDQARRRKRMSLAGSV